jgi:hypothetical protein
MNQMKLLKLFLLTNWGEELNEGQIEQISHNMLIDKVCEEYPEIHIARLFHVNQLLLKPIMESFLIPKRLLFISDTN